MAPSVPIVMVGRELSTCIQPTPMQDQWISAPALVKVSHKHFRESRSLEISSVLFEQASEYAWGIKNAEVVTTIVLVKS